MDDNTTLKKRATTVLLLSLTAIALYFCYLIAKPFLKSAVLAGVIAIIFYPLHSRIRTLFRNPNAAAVVSTIVVILAILVPALALGGAVTRELSSLYQSLSRKSAESGGLSPYFMHLIEKPLAWAGRYVDLSTFDLRAAVQSRVAQASTSLLGFAADLVSNVTAFLLNAVVTFFTLFFLLRDGEYLGKRVAEALPLSRDQVERLYSGISKTVVANVHGVLVVAASQGSLLSLGFWLLGLSSPILWGLVTAVCSLLPVVGTAAVWLPASIVLMASGHWWRGFIVLAWGAAVVGLVDNVLRPFVISGRAKVNTLLIFFALLGGVNAFGLIGLFIGPIALSVTMALLRMLKEEGLTWQSGLGASSDHEETGTSDDSPGTGSPPQSGA